ncbi:MAG: hypothetical protein OK449_04755 [Thaumarchaeota archaeon]|nr:hypothetical protein [Nitrososphaerota archaeon]
MPRGLGDNPLKKEKRARRVGARGNAVSATGPESPSYVSTDVAGPETIEASSQGSRSYNDVFFQRRPENFVPAENSAPEEVHAIDSGTAAHATVAELVSSPVLPEAAVFTSTERVPIDEVAETPAPVPVAVAESVPQIQAAPQLVESPPVNNVAQPLTPAQPAPREEAKTGFFGRIFGRLHK